MIGKSLGHFHIVEKIGEGGMGAVYVAVQDHPRREVAVKVMKAGLTSRDALRRFHYEADILARLGSGNAGSGGKA